MAEPSRSQPQPASRSARGDLGTLVGGFRLKRVLGTSGTGVIYLGERPGDGGQLAIKILHPWLAQDPEGVSCFRAEARAVNDIGHEGIARVLAIDLLPPNRYCLLMENLDGETLEAIAADRGLPVPIAVPILLQICDALQSAHDRGIVHRDVQPGNVLLVRSKEREQVVKLMNFGVTHLARPARETESSRTGTRLDALPHMAPELRAGQPATPLSDIYATGVVAFRILTGELPAGSFDPGDGVAIEKVGADPRVILPSLPEALARAIVRALAERPEDRFRSMAEFAAALAASCAGEHVPPAQAIGWGCQTGFAVDFVQANAALRAAITQLATDATEGATGGAGGVTRAAGRTGAGATATDPADGATRAPKAQRAAAALMARFVGRGHANPYDLLGLPLDAEVDDARARSQRLIAQIEALQRPGLPAALQAELAALLDRVRDATAALEQPERRVDLDAGLGNFRGVARCLPRLAPAELDRRRCLHLARSPAFAVHARHAVLEAARAEAAGDIATARSYYEDALRLDPLSRELHGRYWRLRRGP